MKSKNPAHKRLHFLLNIPSLAEALQSNFFLWRLVVRGAETNGGFLLVGCGENALVERRLDNSLYPLTDFVPEIMGGNSDQNEYLSSSRSFPAIKNLSRILLLVCLKVILVCPQVWLKNG